MANVCPVVVVGLRVGQVHQVIHQKQDCEGEHEEGGELILVRRRHVKAETHPVYYSNDKVALLNAAFLELVLKLPESVFLAHAESNGHQHRDDESCSSSQGSQQIKTVV